MMEKPEKLNLIIVEDDAIISQLIESDLRGMGHQVLDVAHTGAAALKALTVHNPDLVLLDVDLGDGMDGIDVGRTIHEKYHLPFLYLTAFSDRETLERAKQTQPCGYLVKPYKPADLASAISIGLFNFSLRSNDKDLTLEKLNEIANDHLSEREFEIVKDVVSGLTNAQIAENQYLSVNTVKWHLQNIYSKFGVRNRTSLVQVVHDQSN